MTAAKKKRISDDEIFVNSTLPLPDEVIPYTSGPMKARLARHEVTPDFAQAITTIAGGAFRPVDGGTWERCRKVATFLQGQEANATHPDKARLVGYCDTLTATQRSVLDITARAFGIQRPYNSPLLTTGEVAAVLWIATYVATEPLDDMTECITTAFPGTTQILSSPAETPGGVRSSPPGEPPKLKVTRVLEDDLVIPEGYCDGIDVDRPISEVKTEITTLLHRYLIAEVQGKGRKGLIDWLISKNRGFKVPDEMRSGEVDNE